MRKLNILVIGMGHHARRVYIPALNKLAETERLKIFGTDLVETKVTVEEFLRETKIKMTTQFIKTSNNKLGRGTRHELDKFVRDNKITGVIISTPPSSHKMYADWALDNNLHILMDKPISAGQQMANSESQAKLLIRDYSYLLKKYEKKYLKTKTVFMVNTQRRWEVGFQYVFRLIAEVSKKFNIPVTSIQAMHSDGVWIFPDEVIEQQCHSYLDGYGKCSHSGFHLFDIVWQIYQSGNISKKSANSAEVFSSFTNPTGVLSQFDQNDYVKIFGKEYLKRSRRTNAHLARELKGYGELEAFSIIRLLKNGENVCNISLNLLHNSFSRRSWLIPAKDLYKGNGRVKHQYYYIQQGPFQAIQIHNYQSKCQQDKNTTDDYTVGGNNHFDIYVFRNKDMFGKNERVVRKISLKDLDYSNNFDDSRLYHETVKERVVKEFVDCIRNGFNRKDITADISTYGFAVNIMSAIYQSNARYQKNKNPLVKFNIKK